MKKLGLILVASFCLASFGSSVSAQTTYTWNQNSFAAWTTATNWTPTRTTPASNDILVFNSGATTTATGVPGEQIGQLLISGGTTITLQPAAGVLTLTILGNVGTDLSVATGSHLRITGGDTNTNTLKILLAAGATGSIAGEMTFTTAQHQIDAADASGITFTSGSTFTYSPGSAAGNSFTNAGTPSAVVFASGSKYVCGGGASPFGLAEPASKVVFQTGSLYRHNSTAAPSFSGRTYANVEVSFVGVTVTGSSAVSMDDLTVTFGTLNFNMTGLGHSIKGNIVVGAGSNLNFAPASALTVNLNGTSVQAISNSSQLTLNNVDLTVVINNPNGITLLSNVDIRNGTLNLTSGNITTGANRLFISAPATVTRTSGHVIGNLRKGFLAPGTKTFEVGTANGYSPVTLNSTGTFGEFTIKATEGAHPNVNPATSLQRFWTITATTNASADLTFQYLVGDVVGTEANYKVVRVSGGTPTVFPSSTVNPAAHTVSIAGVTSFSDWTASEDVAPTQEFGEVIGQVTNGVGGPPVPGTVVRLTGTQNRKTITDANGRYRFDNVATSGSYTVTPSRVNFVLTPNQRALTQLGNTNDASFIALPTGGTANPLDTPEFFVRQHYVDFLNREPDESGFNFWSDQMISCGSDATCLDRRRTNVSAAYFLSIEFQETGGLVDGLYRTSFDRLPFYSEFVPDTQIVGQNVVVGRTGWENQLETNKQAFLNAWVQRPAFVNAYGTLGDEAYVDTLISHTGVTFTSSERNALVNSLVNHTATRAQVLRQIAEDPRFKALKFNETFVMMEYFGYLRRDPDAVVFSSGSTS